MRIIFTHSETARYLVASISALLMNGCHESGTHEESKAKPASHARATVKLPKGAVAERSGYPSILEAPPSSPSSAATGEPGFERLNADHLFRDLLLLDVERGEIQDVASTGRILLKDGCLWLSTSSDRSSEGDGLLAIPTGATTHVDPNGFAALRLVEDSTEHVRIGELASWGGQLQTIAEERVPARFRRNCGNAPVFLLTNARPANVSPASKSNVPPPP